MAVQKRVPRRGTGERRTSPGRVRKPKQRGRGRGPGRGAGRSAQGRPKRPHRRSREVWWGLEETPSSLASPLSLPPPGLTPTPSAGS